ncbi:MAG: hypothetical protein AOA65_1688 [Candidatus Bathyarchaeota archaeon BA1]|nr:MAG: hypothetical protein AOA65_1688 [Candidatus Bathyarchaeota archaeon BA1]
MPRRKRNPNQFTTDEAQTATLIYAEGAFVCSREIRDKYRYAYPMIEIRMCAKEGLEPASRVFGTKIRAIRTKTIECPPELFPPDGKGRWGSSCERGDSTKAIQRLAPLIPEYHKQKWRKLLERCRP